AHRHLLLIPVRRPHLHLPSFPTRRSSDLCQMNEYDSERVAGLLREESWELTSDQAEADLILVNTCAIREKAEDKVFSAFSRIARSEEHTSELQSLAYLVCRLLLEKKKRPK